MKLMKAEWQKGMTPKAWRRAGEILIPKENSSSTMEQFRQISLLNVEGKIFFTVVAQRLSVFLQKNNFVDTSVQKAGVSGFSGCLEHTNAIGHLVETALKEKNLHVFFFFRSCQCLRVSASCNLVDSIQLLPSPTRHHKAGQSLLPRPPVLHNNTGQYMDPCTSGSTSRWV